MTLFDLKAGQSATIQSYASVSHLTQAIRRQLFSFGLLPQTSVTVVRKAPLGASIEVSIGDTHVFLGQDLAGAIEVSCD